MVTIHYDHFFEKAIIKIRDSALKRKVKKMILKIIDSPEIGKPMRHHRKGTREVYISPFRLSYAYLKDEDTLIFLDIYPKDAQ